MANQVVRPVGYTGTLQQLTWNQGNNVPVSAYLWGGGGGGGGNDSNPGGNGCGSGYSQINFTVNNGDVIGVAVGGAGGPGAGGSGAAGGTAGASWVDVTNFSTLDIANTPGNFRYTNGAYCSFLNQYGIWNITPSAAVFDQTNNITFSSSGYYTIVGSCDNYGTIYIDGTPVLSIDGFQSTYSSVVYVTAGVRAVRIYGYNSGGPGSIGVTINGGAGGYSGGRGGNSGGAGSSGAGGGGGGATVVFLNGVAVGAAGGGAGGGGGGNSGSASGESAPGSRGQGTATSGQNGQDKSGDGGGGGGAGGGWLGGLGGSTPGGDQGGYAGFYGLSSGSYENPTNRNPGGTSNSYYQTGVGRGGSSTASGTSGYAVFQFNIPGGYVHTNGSFTPVSKTWIKANDTWNQVQSIYVKANGIWNQVLGGTPPTFSSASGNFGINPTPYT